MKSIQSQGEYKAPNGQQVAYTFTYEAFDSLQDAIAVLGEPEVLKQVQRMTKVDANNTAREKAKTANGHSSRKPMSEEEKAAAKVERASNKQLLEAIKAQGIGSVEDLKKILG
jgi:hypothetical protein